MTMHQNTRSGHRTFSNREDICAITNRTDQEHWSSLHSFNITTTLSLLHNYGHIHTCMQASTHTHKQLEKEKKYIYSREIFHGIEVVIFSPMFWQILCFLQPPEQEMKQLQLHACSTLFTFTHPLAPIKRTSSH